MSREKSNYEQVSLISRMQEYIRQMDCESRQSLSGSYVSPKGDHMQFLSKRANKVIEAVMQSTEKGKVLLTLVFLSFLLYCILFDKFKWDSIAL